MIDFAPTKYSEQMWGLAALLAMVLALLGLSFFGGYKVAAAKYLAEKAETAEILAGLTKAANEVTIKYETVFVDRVKKVYIRGREITKEVPIYVTVEDDRACELRNGFVRVFDASLRGEPAGPAADTDRAPSGIALSRATEAITSNNTELRACREKLRGWQDYYDDLRKTYGK